MEEFIRAKKLIDASENMLVIAHRRPDGDTLGCACAWNLAMQSLGKSCTLVCVDKPSERFGFLPEINKFVTDFNPSAYDLIVLPDIADLKMTVFNKIYPDLFDGSVPIVLFDHHFSNEGVEFAINLIDPKAASASVIMYRFFEFAGVNITPQIATSLLTGIYNDTGSFMHSNTSLDVFKISSELAQKGAKTQIIIKNMFRNIPISTLKLWGKALENLKINEDNVAISVLTKKDFRECGAEPSESGGIIERMSAIPGIKFAILLHESGNNVKGSMRTNREDVDLIKISELFGGGGHKKASGFTIPGRIEREITWKIVPDAALGSAKDASSITGLSIEQP